MLLGAAQAAARDAPASGVPGAQIQARVDACVERERGAWKADLPHYAQIFPIEPADLDAYMAQVFARFDGRDVALGGVDGVETHGGGLLAFLFADWRPDSRAARASDRYWFERNRSRLALARIYESYERQIYLPIPGREPEAIAGVLPDTPQLARMQFRQRLPGGKTKAVDVDAYSFSRLLVEREEDLSRTWVNQFGQTLSADLLLRQAWGHYLARRSDDDDLVDHSNLHLVEVLLAYSRRRSSPAGDGGTVYDPNEIKRRFLAVELRQTDFAGEDWILRIGHHLESLGHLLSDPRVDWNADERRQVLAWLRSIDRASDHELSGVEVVHFVKGLRALAAQRTKLADPAP